MIINFSSLGSGDSKQVDLCGECGYTLKISRRGRAPQAAWLTGAQIMEQYGSQDVKITVRGIKRCARHAARGGVDSKARSAFIEQALKSGIDLNDDKNNKIDKAMEALALRVFGIKYSELNAENQKKIDIALKKIGII